MIRILEIISIVCYSIYIVLEIVRLIDKATSHREDKNGNPKS